MSEPENGGAARILISDDDSAVVSLLARVLGKAGYQVVLAEDAALSPRGIDLIIADLNSPTDDSMEALRHLRTLNPGVRVIGTAGLADEGLRPRARQAGARAVLQKPFSLSELLHEVRRVLNPRGIC